VRFAYPDGTLALEDLDLHVRPGETVALVGATGGGKSTVARLAARFYDTDAGRVLLDGVDVRDYPLATLRDRVGIVPDEPFLFSMSLHELMRDRTTIVVAHRLATIGLADRVVLIENGRAVASGTHATLLATEPRYAAVLAASGREVSA